MKLSISSSVPGYEEEEAIRMIAEAGFDAVDVSLCDMIRNDNDPYMLPNYMEHVKEIKKLGEDLGITYNQSHCIFPPQKQDEDEYNRKAFDILKRTVEIAHELGIKTIAFHPFKLTYGDEAKANIEFLQKLTPYVKGSGAKFALENTFYYADAYPKKVTEITQKGIVIREEMMPRKRFTKVGSYCIQNKKMLDELDRDCFCALLDTGHAVLVHEDPVSAIKLLGDDLGGLHIHDVDGYADMHSTPFDVNGIIDWDNIAKALKEINYKGDFTLESELFVLRFPKELVPYCYKVMERTGRYIMEKIK